MEKLTVIAATDFSHRAQKAVKRAALLCREQAGTLTLVHAINLRFFERLLVGERRLQLKEDVTRKLKHDLDELKVSGEALVEIGFPSDVIMDTARIQNPQLVVLGDHGEFHLKDVLLGTTARHVIEHAHLPLLVVKSDNEAPYQRILLATDFSDSSRRAVELAATFFPKAQFVVFHAYLTPGKIVTSHYGLAGKEVETMLEQMRTEALEKVERFKESLSIAPENIKTVVRGSASPTEDILDVCETEKADLLVMGTKGMGSFMPLMVGSATDSLLRHSGVDMLIYKA